MPSAVIIERPAAVEPNGEQAEAQRGPRRRNTLQAPTMTTVFGVSLALIMWIFELRPLRDNSFLWHLKTGHWILDNGFPRGDIFSFTAPGTPWVAQSWLAEVIYALLDRAFGPYGIQVFRAVVAAAIVMLVFRLAVRIVGERGRALALTFAAVCASSTLWVERPLLLGVLFMVVLLWIVEVPDSLVGRRPFVSVPLLMWVWVNTHGTFALGFAFLGLHVLGRWLDGARPWEGRERRLVLASLLAFGLCFVNPYGASMVTFPLHLLSRGEVLQFVREWKSPDFHSAYGVMFGVWLVAFGVSLAHGQNRCSRRDLLVGGAFLLLAFWALRNVAVAPFIGLAVAGRKVAVAEARLDQRLTLNWVALAMVLLLGLVAAVDKANLDNWGFEGYPVEAMKVVEEEGFLGQELAAPEAWGAYVIHEYWPRQHVFMDDRYDMYPTSISKDYFALGDADEGWDRILDRYGIDVVVWHTEKPLARLLDVHHGWKRIHRDDLATVWVRT